MICLSDNDFLKKLAVCDLLSEAMEETVRAGLTSYVTDLHQHTGALLVES